MISLTRKVTRDKVHIKVDSVDVKCCHSHTDLVCISIGNMKAHIESVHDGIKNHQCEICGKSFALNTDLKSS